jgi:hypothetical protein
MRGIVNGGVERFVIGDVDGLSANIQPGAAQPPGFVFGALRIDVKDCHPCSVRSERFGVTQADPACSAGDDNAIPVHIKKICYFHSCNLRCL